MAEGSYSLMELRDLKKDLEREKAYEKKLLNQHYLYILARSTGEINPRTNPSVAFHPIIGGRRETTNIWSRLEDKIERSRKAMAKKEARVMELVKGLSKIPSLVLTGRDFIPCFEDLKDRGGWRGTVEISNALPETTQSELTDMGFNVLSI